ncbi:DUF2207 domain-containing protein [Microbacterium oxydans]|uniref:DUF2207 domain-containing protein n=1 Tax=Microbacterium sp. B19(2022) TaxID=2914045 RepID=UPI001431C837|nr:DUF2207 domain-containing protein [Microbacterium sp. B19(2022)]NJI59691.1 DUF2207 domain-containing protein [Microbacterium sp. B19(2022)]
MAHPRILRAFAALAVAFATTAVAPPAAAAADVGPGLAPQVRADTEPGGVDDFSYASWDAVYEVGLDDEGRARTHVTETLVARFPETDQNHGIVRGLLTSYEGASTETQVLSVTDEDGQEVPHETDEEDGLLYVLTGDDDTYVHGLTTYVIEYEMRDTVIATKPAAGASTPSVDEFYWNLLPLDSTQPIERFRADIVLDEELGAALTGSTRCYTGPTGSRTECELRGPQTDGSVTVFGVESGERAAGDGVTVAIGFEPGTVAQPLARTPDPVGDVAPFVAAAGAAGLTVGSWFAVWAFRRRRRVATGIVVAQYDVPDSLPPLIAATVITGAKDVIPAEIVHLAVRGSLRIEEGVEAEESRLRRIPGAEAPDELDAEALDALFLDADADGVVDLPAADEAFAARMTALQQSGTTAAASRGFTERVRSRGAVIVQWCAIGVALIGLGLGIWAATSGRLSAIPALVVMSFVAFLVFLSSVYAFSKHTVLTAEGARTSEYLQGVKEFIRVADADRLQMLQSYSGAERRQDGTADVIHVYERLLPYAILFGMEDEWGDVLERAYAQEQHGASWIGDPTSFALRMQLASFMASSQSAATYSAPSAGGSSSAGGSFGGGFSGGGGGGGFSGGR